MAKAMRIMRERLARDRELGLVIEVRDARIPMTSVNPNLDQLLNSSASGSRIERLIVHTKRDLAEPMYEELINNSIANRSGRPLLSLFVDTKVDTDIKQVLDHVREVTAHRTSPGHTTKILVVGMPNVGKSSLLNALRRVGVRKGKSARTGALPGITRKVTGTVKIWEDPPIQIYDSPGVMFPNIGNSEMLMRIALTAGIKETLVNAAEVADYLLYRLNLFDPQCYLERTGLQAPTNSTDEALSSIAIRTGKKQSGGILNLEAAAVYFLQCYRQGHFGRYTLDEVGQDGQGYTRFLETGQILERTTNEPDPQSKNQIKKKAKQEAKVKRDEKWARIQVAKAASG